MTLPVTLLPSFNYDMGNNQFAKIVYSVELSIHNATPEILPPVMSVQHLNIDQKPDTIEDQYKTRSGR